MLLSRPMKLIRTTNLSYPPRVKVNIKCYSLNKFLEDLNNRDHGDMMNGHLKHLSEWKPTSLYSSVLETFDNNKLFNLVYISNMYRIPLEDYQKIKIRTDIKDYYKKANSDEEKEMYLVILNYYKLLD